MSCIDTTLLMPVFCGAASTIAYSQFRIEGKPLESAITSLLARTLFVAQSVLSAVALPFLILHTIFHGLYTLYSEGSWVTLSINMARVIGHTTLVPLGILLALAPVTPVENAARRLAAQAQNMLEGLPPDWQNNPQVQDFLRGIQQILPQEFADAAQGAAQAWR